MISVKGVSKSFGSIKALDRVSFEIPKGQVVGLLGPNGAGKTTMMRLMTGYFPPSEGEILIEGVRIHPSKPVHRRNIGYLGENNPLYQDMLTIDFLKYVAGLKGIPFGERRKAIALGIEQCGLESAKKRIIGKLSKGFQQRVGLAQALLGDPKILILDEPTAGLDPKQIIDIRKLIIAIGMSRTVLLSSHILHEVQTTCQSVLILNRGKLMAQGASHDLEEKIRGAQELILKIQGDWKEGDAFLKNVSGVIGIHLRSELGNQREYAIAVKQDKDIRSELARHILDSGFELLSLKLTEWDLEDIFLKIVTCETEEAVS
jgi:ABC-2 type transport system ATP-binding protein